MRRRRPRHTILVTILIALAVGTGTGSAHEDLRIVDETIELGPGEVARFPTAIHYHRIVGRYAVLDGTSDVSLSLASVPTGADAGPLAIASPGASERPADERSGGFEVVLAGTLASSGTLNELIRCCDQSVWTEAQLVVRNDGDHAATIDLRAWAMHDDFAVIVDRAEPGAVTAPLALFLALGVAAVVVAWREGRRAEPAASTGHTPPSLRWSTGLFLGALTIAAALGLAGTLRYGAGPVDGTIAILADLPVPGGPFGARGATVMGLLMLAWMSAIGFWIRALHVGAQRRSARPRRLGLALGAVSVAGGVALGWTYGSFGAPLILGLVLGVPLVTVSLLLGRPGLATDATAPR